MCVFAVTLKTLYADEHMFIDMECISNFEGGQCPQDDVSFYVHTRQHNDSVALLEYARDGIQMLTHGCYDVSGLHRAMPTG